MLSVRQMLSVGVLLLVTTIRSASAPIYGFAAYNEGELKSHGVRDNTTIKTEQTDMEAGVGLIHYF